MAPNVLKISWTDIHRDASQLAATLAPQGPWKGIIAITRGGMVPSTIMAYELDIRHLDAIALASYDNEHSQGDIEVLRECSVEDEGDGWLVIDDLVDTGVTSQIVRKILPKAHIAVVYAKPQGKGSVDTHLREVTQDTWLVFPWEEKP